MLTGLHDMYSLQHVQNRAVSYTRHHLTELEKSDTGYRPGSELDEHLQQRAQ